MILNAKSPLGGIEQTNGDNFLDDLLVEQIWHDLKGQVSRDQILQVANQVAAKYKDSLVTNFVPIFIRRQTHEILRLKLNGT
jgi:hypothetical protein